MSDYTMRALTEGDFTAQRDLVADAFLFSGGIEELGERMRIQLAGARHLGVFDGDRIVGTASVDQRTLTLPEGVTVPFAAVTYVSVAADHRRRGVLTSLMRAQLHEVHESGGPAIAALWASEAAIYQRFGYGPATGHIDYTVTAKAPFRAGVDLGTDRVREVPAEQAVELARPIYDEYAASRAGGLNRDDAHWRDWLFDPPGWRHGQSARRWAVHPRGFTIYRVKHGHNDRGPAGTVEVEELISLTPQAHAALLRHTLDMDLASEVTFWLGMDDPMPLMLNDSRIAVGKVADGLHIRLVDVDRALVQRRYRSAVDVVIEVSDPLCPWNEGRLRLVVDDKGAATATRTGDPADLSTSATELGAAYLGGTRLTRLCAAGRVVEHTSGAVAALSAALLADPEPRALEVF